MDYIYSERGGEVYVHLSWFSIALGLLWIISAATFLILLVQWARRRR